MRVGLFPECEEILVSSFGFRGITGASISAVKTQMSERAEHIHIEHSRAVDNLLKLSGRSRVVTGRQICLTAQVNCLKVAQLMRRGRGKCCERSGGVAALQRDGRTDQRHANELHEGVFRMPSCEIVGQLCGSR